MSKRINDKEIKTTYDDVVKIPKELEAPGKRLGYILEQRNITQMEFAKMLGAKPTSISRYVAWGVPGNRNGREPSCELLKKMAEILGVSTDQILGVESSPLGGIKVSPTEIINAIKKNVTNYTNDEKMQIIKSIV